MNIQELAKKLEGIHTVQTISKILNISKRTAINYIWKLRKKGLVETIYGKRKIRMYKIKAIRKLERGYPGLYDMINENSKVKIVPRYSTRIYTHKLTIEEAIVKAVKTKEFRIILASLGLFNKIKNWHLLNEFAKKEEIGRKLGALYDTARKVIKLKRMDNRTKKSLLRSKVNDKSIINGLKTKDFKDIEEIWNVYIPFNKSDLEVYKE